MCGRFTLTATIDVLLDRFDVESFLQEEEYFPSYNVAPSQSVLAVINNGKANRMGFLRWGLIPPWANDMSIGYKMINARSETLTEKPSFKNVYQKKRCIIVADSFYEWKRVDSKTKIPMRIKLKSNHLFAMAGLWEKWKSPEGKDIFSCSVITTSANELVKDIHDRMPVILNPKDERTWLDPSLTEYPFSQSFIKTARSQFNGCL